MGDVVEWETPWDWYGATHYNEDLPTTFLITIDSYDYFSDTDGKSLGGYSNYSATLKFIAFHELKITRDMAILMYGYQAVELAENLASEKFAEENS